VALDDLREWADRAWQARLEELRDWSVGRFDGLP
jgi:hypothetical protein